MNFDNSHAKGEHEAAESHEQEGGH
jgi:hypothetical protein